MLSEEEKGRIRTEEIFRAEVRRELEGKEPSSRAKRFWTFLNSSFALWFLSSVVLAGLTTAVTSYQAKRSERLRKAQIERRLDTEISSRIGLTLRTVRLERAKIASGQAQPPGTAYGNAESYLDNSFPNTSWDFSIYPEYKARTFRSLVSELTSIADPSEQPDLKEAILGYDKLLDLAFRANGAEDETTEAKSVIDLLERLTKHRWQSPESAQEVSN